MAPVSTSTRSSSFCVTMVPVLRPNSAIASLKAAVSRLRVCGSVRDPHTWTGMGGCPRSGTMKSTSRPLLLGHRNLTYPAPA